MSSLRELKHTIKKSEKAREYNGETFMIGIHATQIRTFHRHFFDSPEMLVWNQLRHTV